MGAEDWGVVALGGFASFIANVLYMWGGTEMSWGGQKWLRRFLASFVLTLAAGLTALYLGKWSFRYLLMFPCLSIGFSLGYGRTAILLKRTVCAVGILSACFVGLWITGFSGSGWLVFAAASVCGLTSIIMGFFNPFSNAPLEQFLISQVLTMFIPFWAFVR